MQKFFKRQEAWVKNVEERETERAKQTNKRQKDEASKKVLFFLNSKLTSDSVSNGKVLQVKVNT